MARSDTHGAATPSAHATACAFHSDQHFGQLLDALPAAIYATDAQGRITHYNRACVELSGREPTLGTDQWCVTWKLYYADGRPMPHDQCPMAVTLREGRPIPGVEAIAERPDGTRVWIAPYPTPLFDNDGKLVGGVNMLVDITEQRQHSQSRALLSAIVDSSDDAIISKNLDGMITSWNRGADRIFGYTAEEAIGQPVLMLIPPERQFEERDILARLRRGERVDHFETIRLRKDGARLDISLTISPVTNDEGRIVGASKIARDITERRRTEQLLRELQRQYTQSLEHKVESASAELFQSQERLRVAERMVALGTLSAGLGHDMGNVLMPLRAHVDAIAAHLPKDLNGFRHHFEAIHRSLDYLRTLSGGLRMLATDPESARRTSSAVQLDRWWEETEPLLRTALGRKISLRREIEPNLPPIRIPSHLLTQAVFNLVQNSAQAMTGTAMQSDCWVRIGAAREGAVVCVSVADNGPGMNREVREHCLEPYFTTKTRAVSTGMGLSLVNGIVQSAGATLEVVSEPGAGTTFTMCFPIVAEQEFAAMRVLVRVSNMRTRALLRHLLTSTEFSPTEHQDEAQLLVTDSVADAQAFVTSQPTGRAVVLGAAENERAPDAQRVTYLPRTTSVAQIRQALEASCDDSARCET